MDELRTVCGFWGHAYSMECNCEIGILLCANPAQFLWVWWKSEITCVKSLRCNEISVDRVCGRLRRGEIDLAIDAMQGKRCA